ncbi:MAG: LysR family glycine cleavage system transcriptional activator [Litorivivens sp.]|jgi:LysR family glycine cleavage system transcriptional activator
MTKHKPQALSPTTMPSMQSLRAFQATARFGSTVRAAEYLHITPSAITHQLRKLEGLIGVQLVRRVGRTIELTSAGNQYAKKISDALDLIAQAPLSAYDAEPSGKLCIKCASGFGAYWVSQHLGEFTQLYPNIAITFLTQNDKLDVYSNEVDFSIVYGDGYWPDMNVTLLYSPRFFPVCSPLLLNKLGNISQVNDLERFPLLHHLDHGNWASWLAVAKADHVKVDQGTVFTDINLCLAAALAGHGVAISDNVLSNKLIQEGSLVRVLDQKVLSPQSYYLVVKEDRKQRQVCAACINWFISEFDKLSSQRSRII